MVFPPVGIVAHVGRGQTGSSVKRRLSVGSGVFFGTVVAYITYWVASVFALRQPDYLCTDLGDGGFYALKIREFPRAAYCTRVNRFDPADSSVFRLTSPQETGLWSAVAVVIALAAAVGLVIIVVGITGAIRDAIRRAVRARKDQR